MSQFIRCEKDRATVCKIFGDDESLRDIVAKVTLAGVELVAIMDYDTMEVKLVREQDISEYGYFD